MTDLLALRDIECQCSEENVPTYQYACTACDHQFEVVQSFTDAPLGQCPTCEGQLRKLFGSVGVVFKGSGFYRTDSRAAAAANGAGGKKDRVNGSGPKGAGARGAAAKDTATAGADGASGSAATGTSSSGSTSASGGASSSGGTS